MSTSGCCGRSTTLLVLCTVALLNACGRSTGPLPLFAIDARQVHYPVMLSEVHADTGARDGDRIDASSQIHSEAVRIGNYRYWRSWNDRVPAFVILLSRVEPFDLWIQFKRAVFRATDFRGAGESSFDEELTVEAETYK